MSTFLPGTQVADLVNLPGFDLEQPIIVKIIKNVSFSINYHSSSYSLNPFEKAFAHKITGRGYLLKFEISGR